MRETFIASSIIGYWQCERASEIRAQTLHRQAHGKAWESHETVINSSQHTSTITALLRWGFGTSFCREWVELSETGFSFGWFKWRSVEFFLKTSITKITIFEVKCVFWLVDWNWSGPRTNPYVKFLRDLCVYWWRGETGGRALERVRIFILAEGLKIEFFGNIR